MKAVAFLYLAASLAASVDALQLRQRDVPAVVGLDIQRKEIPDPVSRDKVRRKRDKTVTEILDNEVQITFPYFGRISCTHRGFNSKPYILPISPWAPPNSASA